MRIVSNTSPLIGLAKIDCLSILKDIASVDSSNGS